MSKHKRLGSTRAAILGSVGAAAGLLLAAATTSALPRRARVAGSGTTGGAIEGWVNGANPNLSLSANGIIMQEASGQTSNPSAPVGGNVFSVCWGSGSLTPCTADSSRHRRRRPPPPSRPTMSSAEWAIEPPYYNSFAPLADYGQLTFDPVLATGAPYTSASATWQVANVSYDSGHTGAQYMLTWTGIGGCFDSTLLQLGTEAVVSTSGATFYVWYELYPVNAQRLPQTVHPGDIVTASLECTAVCSPAQVQTWQLTITDETRGWTWTQSFQNQSSTCPIVRVSALTAPRSRVAHSPCHDTARLKQDSESRLAASSEGRKCKEFRQGIAGHAPTPGAHLQHDQGVTQRSRHRGSEMRC